MRLSSIILAGTLLFLGASLTSCNPNEVLTKLIPKNVKMESPLKPTPPTQKAKKSKKLDPKDVERASQINYVTELYRVVLGSEPEDKERFSSWVEALSGGFSREGVYHAFVLSDRYKALSQSPSYLVSDEAKEFAKQEIRFITNKTPELLPKNLFQLKKEFAELVLSHWQTLNPSDQKKWYVATATRWASYHLELGAPIRNTTDSRTQKKWIQEAPPEVVLSELLIRSHLLFNRYFKQPEKNS